MAGAGMGAGVAAQSGVGTPGRRNGGALLLAGSCAAALCGFAAGAQAQERQIAQADPVTVTATRTALDLFGAPSTVTVIGAEDIETILADDIKDLIRFEPGVSVTSAPARFTAALASTGRDGNAGFNIRGLDGNRVLFQVDGVRVPDAFSFGPASFGRGDYVDLDILQSVEIVRGPASALYGSDGLAGVVSFITRDPDGFLRGDENFALRLRAGYASANDAYTGGVSAAGRAGPWSALFAYTYRDGHETENQGENDALNSTRTTPNPQDITSNSALARIVFAPSAQHRFRLTGDWGDREIITEAYAGRSAGAPIATSVIDLDGVDESERSRLALDYTFENEGGAIDRAFAAVYAQQSALRQFTAEDRFTAADRTRETRFENEVWGASLQLESAFDTGGVSHRLTYGGDYSVTRQEGVRDGTVPPVGESFPSRPFPNTDYTLAGLFVQDEISFLDGQIVLFPAVRYDSYELEPENDALYTAPVSGQSDDRVSPRLGVVIWPAQWFGVFANVAAGYKAPSPSQVNNNFANPLQGYVSIPNPDLRPETSESVEVGVRLRDVRFAGADWRASATAFAGQYDNFIEQIQVGGSFTPMDPARYQFVNLREAEISGAEARAQGRWENGFGFIIAASFAEGDQITGGTRAPLLSVDPVRVVAGLSYDAPSRAFGGQLIATYASEKDAADVCAGCFIPPEYTVFDMTAYWRITPDAVIRAGVFNISDETYWHWSDVRGLSGASAVRDAFTHPGRNFSISISTRF